MIFQYFYKKWRTYSRSSRDCLTFSSVILLLMFIFTVMLTQSLTKSNQINSQLRLKTSAEEVENTILSVFKETNRFMEYIGKQIAENDPNDLAYISDLLKKTSQIKYSNSFLISWPLFFWVNSSNLTLVNSHLGILQKPLDISCRSYTQTCPLNPWKLCVSPPAASIPNGEWIIPAGMGVTSTRQELLGFISVGFNIAEFNTKLKELLAPKNVSCIVLDGNFNIVFQTPDNPISPQSTYFKEDLSGKFSFPRLEALLDTPISCDDIDYLFYKRIPGYSYIILVGYNKYVANKEFQKLLFPRIVEFCGMGFFGIFLLYIFRRRILKVTRVSHQAKEEFMKSVNQHVRQNMDTALEYSNVLLKHLKGDIKVIISKERQIEFMSTIQESIMNLYSTTSHMLELKELDLNRVLKEAIAIKLQNALLRNVCIKTQFKSHMPIIHGDKICLKQIITGLLSISIEYMPSGGNIHVSADFETAGEKQMFIITLKDDGFGLSDEDIQRISNKFDPQRNQKINAIDLDMSTILKLVDLHKGTCEINSIWGQGRTVILKFPTHPNASQTFINNSDVTGNVYSFSRPRKGKGMQRV